MAAFMAIYYPGIISELLRTVWHFLFPVNPKPDKLEPKGGHCEERSDVAIQMISLKAFLMAGLPRLLPRFARS